VALLGTVLLLNLVLGALLAVFIEPHRSTAANSFFGWVWENGWVFASTTALWLALFTLVSVYTASELREGGIAVARSLGAKWISPRTTDLSERQVLNVVEELSVASGLPVPQVYLLEKETGINTFSAGHNPANAAIIVTQGALERLNRAELQGVIAHEFSHVLNGDMLLNIRMMAPLRGLTLIASVARATVHILATGQITYTLVWTVVGSALVIALQLFLQHVLGIEDPPTATFIMATATFIIGGLGSILGSLIQAAVSRRREMLADALSVQLTRDPNGLKGALVKVAAMAFGSYLHHPRANAIAHMLFAQGTIHSFDTHPPLLARIKALDASFDEREIDTARARRPKAKASEVNARLPARRLDAWSGTPLSSSAVVELVGSPAADHLLAAELLLARLPESLIERARHPESARALLLALAMDFRHDGEGREQRQRQLSFIARGLSPSIAGETATLSGEVDGLAQDLRVPLLLKLLPTLRQLPQKQRRRLVESLTEMLQREGTSPYTYALRKLAQVQLFDELEPQARARSLTLGTVRNEACVLFSVLAHFGNGDPLAVRQAYASGMQHLYPKGTPHYELPHAWTLALDKALDRLDRLIPPAKGTLVEALVKVVMHDRHLLLGEAELLRLICGVLHCPLPPLITEAREENLDAAP
jgi:Zn-dependent protease with chaperone function